MKTGFEKEVHWQVSFIHVLILYGAASVGFVSQSRLFGIWKIIIHPLFIFIIGY